MPDDPVAVPEREINVGLGIAECVAVDPDDLEDGVSEDDGSENPVLRARLIVSAFGHHANDGQQFIWYEKIRE